jgi:hypothetical protein
MRARLITLILFTQTIFAQSSDTVFYGVEGIVTSKGSAHYVRYYNYDSSIDRYKYTQWSLLNLSHGYEGSGELKSIDPEIKDGEFKKIDHFGNHVTYLYKDNNFIDIISYQNTEGKPLQPIYPIRLIDSIFYKEDFFLDFIKKTTNSLKAQNPIDKLNSCNIAVVEFIIEVDGSPSNVQVIIGCNNIFDDQIIKIIMQKRFEPRTHNGIYVRSSVLIPIRIKK